MEKPIIELSGLAISQNKTLGSLKITSVQILLNFGNRNKMKFKSKKKNCGHKFTQKSRLKLHMKLQGYKL